MRGRREVDKLKIPRYQIAGTAQRVYSPGCGESTHAMTVRMLPLQFFVSVVFIGSNSVSSAAKILAIPSPVHSHCAEVNGVTSELLRRGHEVTMYLPSSFNEKSCVEAKTKIIRYNDEEYKKDFEEFKMSYSRKGFSGNLKAGRQILGHIRKLSCSPFLEDVSGLERLRDEKFDIAIIDCMFFHKCYFLAPYNLSVPYVAISSWLDELDSSCPIASNFVPNPIIFPAYTDHMNYFQRLMNTASFVFFRYFMYFSLPALDHRLMASGLTSAEAEQLVKKSELFLENSDVVLNYAKPSTPNRVQVGGLTTGPAKPLPVDLKEFLDRADDGAILVSFGSIFVNFTSDDGDKLLRVFEKFKQKFIWKYMEDKTVQRVKMMRWIPQNDILGHPNVVLFISHCGNNGHFESLYHGVPLLCVPLGIDQLTISRRVEYFGAGLRLPIQEFTEDRLSSAITEILDNPKYSKEMKRLSAIYRSRPLTPAQRAASAVEHVLQFGGKHLRSQNVNQSDLQILLVDVWFGIFALLLTFLLAVGLLVGKLWRYYLRRIKVKTS